MSSFLGRYRRAIQRRGTYHKKENNMSTEQQSDNKENEFRSATEAYQVIRKDLMELDHKKQRLLDMEADRAREIRALGSKEHVYAFFSWMNVAYGPLSDL